MANELTRRSFLGASAAAGAAWAGQATGRQVRIGVVGGGFGSSFQWHLHPNCKVTAVCDIRPDRLQRLSEVYRCGNTYRSFREMLKHPELDAVAVFTPAPLHAWMDIEAMKAGKHVISAVPAAMSEEELARILETVKSTGLKYMMAETSFYRPEIITCRQWARAGEFGTIFYSEAEYHHEGLIPLMWDERGFPTWRHGFPPMHYPTHSTGMVVPVTGERLVEVQAVGWGDNHEILQTNQYGNPFWNTAGFFKTSGGHSSRIAVFWHVAAGGTERGQFYGDRLSYILERPEGSPNTVIRINKGGKTVLDANGYPQGEVKIEAYKQPNHWEKLPEALRVRSGHGGSHTFITHEFTSAILEDRHPEVNIWEAIAYTLPGIVAHRSALRDGEVMKIRDYGTAPA
jgi:predicted dehydrogenase